MTDQEKRAMARRIYAALVHPSCAQYEATRAACIAEEDYDTFRDCQQMAFEILCRPTKLFRVSFEIRNRGAIGRFEWSDWRSVEAITSEHAIDLVRSHLLDFDFETRGVKCEEARS